MAATRDHGQDADVFLNDIQLPTPTQVRVQAQVQYSSGESLDKRHDFGGYGTRPPAYFPSSNLFVKWGPAVHYHEFKTLQMLNSMSSGSIPVPQVYAWRVDGADKFIYMELLDGETLEKAWDGLATAERDNICSQLRSVLQNLRFLQQGSQTAFVGTVDRGRLYDRGISVAYLDEAGPFPSVKAFNDWFVFLHRRPFAHQASVPLEPFRQDIPDNDDIKMTHGDFHRSNIIVSRTSPPRILGLVDWEQSGWLPAYWEDCKAFFTARRDDWATIYLPLILDGNPQTREAWDYYTSSMGAF